jgi:DNA-binding NarL/FixJ family response regulator
MEKINIVIVDDQNLFRQSLALLINTVSQFNLIAEFDNADPLLQMLSATDDTNIDVAVIDMDMPGINGMNSILR